MCFLWHTASFLASHISSTRPRHYQLQAHTDTTSSLLWFPCHNWITVLSSWCILGNSWSIFVNETLWPWSIQIGFVFVYTSAPFCLLTHLCRSFHPQISFFSFVMSPPSLAKDFIQKINLKSFIPLSEFNPGSLFPGITVKDVHYQHVERIGTGVKWQPVKIILWNVFQKPFFLICHFSWKALWSWHELPRSLLIAWIGLQQPPSLLSLRCVSIQSWHLPVKLVVSSWETCPGFGNKFVLKKSCSLLTSVNGNIWVPPPLWLLRAPRGHAL